MPGLVVFRRRWSVGSDDLVVPGLFLFTVHLIWTVILSILLGVIHFDRTLQCVLYLWTFIIVYLGVLGVSMAIEIWICVVALRGSILDTAPRASMQYILYIRLGVMLIEAGWLSAGITWLVKFYVDCPIDKAKETVLSLIICNWCILFSVIITVWCTYDAAGRSWVKMKQYQRSMRESELKFQYKRSGSTRNWRQRKVLRAYQDSWQQRCRFLFCCSRPSDRNRNSFADIARLLSDFFRDLDVVPSDVVAGLVLLRKFQKIERKAIVEQRKNDTYEFLSGVAITPRTQFLSLHEPSELELFQTVIRFAHFAVRAYGWPIYIMSTTMGVCRICPDLSCCCWYPADTEVVQDNCCRCNYAVLQKLKDIGDIEVVYATYHVDVGETPFFVALDYDKRKVVVSVRGTLSMKDILTDLNAESETLPLTPPRDDWQGHKGMVQAAQYILEKLRSERLIERALDYKPEKGTREFKLVIVGHSLGAGTASILGILMRQQYPDLEVYCYSPPGGLLSMPAVEYTKSFTISVVMGKDVVPRIGLHQMETLRADLINAIKRSVDPKWKTIACSIMCCGYFSQPTSAVELSTGDSDMSEYMRSKDRSRCVGMHPTDSSIALTSHQPLYPPGRIIHVVRHHPTKGEQALTNKEPVYQALWAQNTDFDEVLISPVMIQDHMPDKVLDALNKVVTTLGPKKPHRSSNNNGCWEDCTLLHQTSPPLRRYFLETSFTSLQSPSGAASNASSVTNGYFSTVSQSSPVFCIVPEKPRRVQKCQSLSLNLSHEHSTVKIDLIHDDWFGLAPLASPESLSEVSSISSRASYLNLEKIQILNGSYELKTPKVMRRTPKIPGNLSTCADDIRHVRCFERLGQKIYRPKCSSSSSQSYESAAGEEEIVATGDSSDFQSAEDILDNVIQRAGCSEFFSKPLETHFDFCFDDKDETSTNPLSPQEDQDLLSNIAIDLTLDEEHRSVLVTDSGSACRTPSEGKNVTFSPLIININTTPSPEDTPTRKPDRWRLLPSRNKRTSKKVESFQQPVKTILCKRAASNSGGDEFFARTEALPLLSGLGNSERCSPGFVRRKKYVYPAVSVRSGSESSV